MLILTWNFSLQNPTAVHMKEKKNAGNVVTFNFACKNNYIICLYKAVQTSIYSF